MNLLDLPLLAGALLALSLAAPPGPANAMMAHEGARRGFPAGLVTGLGAISADFCMFLATRFGVVRVVVALPWLQVALGLVGAALMAYFAWGAWRLARSPHLLESRGAGGYGRNFLAIITSPFNWGWWLSFGASYFALFSPGDSVLAAAGFFGGLLLWVAAWVLLARVLASRIERLAHWLAYASAAALLVFGVLAGAFAIRTAVGLLG